MKGVINNKIVLGIGMYIVTFLVSILIVSGIVWHLGWHISPFVMIIAILLALPVFMLIKMDKKEVLTAVSISLSIIFLSTLMETFVYDVSYDGNAYHQPTIYALAHGWNPVREHHNPVIADSWDMNVWIDHYSKGAETISAVFYAVTGNIESGKALNLLLPISLFLILYYFFKERFIVRLSNRKSILYSIGIAFSMITMGQLTSFYIDHVGYFTFILALIGTYDLINGRSDGKFAYWCIACSILLAGSVKVNMLFWGGFIMACAIIILLIKKRAKIAMSLAVFCSLVAIAAIVVLAYNPFVCNYLDYRNPFYPLFDKRSPAGDAISICGQPPYIQNAPRYKQIAYSYFQRPTNDMTATGYVPPYIITPTNIFRSGFCSTNVGGGGLFFIEILLMTFFIYLFFRKGKYYKQFVVVAILLISTLFILPLGSLFRYVPFIYLLPFLALLYLETIESQTKQYRIAKNILAALLICNITLCTGVTFATTALEQTVTMRSVKMLEGQGGESFYTSNWGFCNKLYHGDMNGKHPVSPLFPESQYEREKYIGGPYVYIKTMITDE
ncbi:MAG: hypothetical protein IJQ69_02925 [Bacteroidales bacterium]|nr:hypothetical protein [Bacteroidales bacterium]